MLLNKMSEKKTMKTLQNKQRKCCVICIIIKIFLFIVSVNNYSPEKETLGHTKSLGSQVWERMPVMPALGRLKQGDWEFEASLAYNSETLYQKQSENNKQ